ncbi:uncharacterized protein AB9W97_000112 isoform 1-T6 [Spinachia spinachia]
MAQRMFHESGQEGRSVLGMLEVQVERDSKTGVTAIRSVAPVSTTPGEAIFDDGRRSIHAVGGSGSQPSTKELGHILSIVDGVGMKALLDEVVLAPIQEEAATRSGDVRTAPGRQVVSFSTLCAPSKEDNAQFGSSEGGGLEAEPGMELRSTSMAPEEDKKGDLRISSPRDTAGEVGHIEELRMEDGPVTLIFLGYTDGDQGDGQEEPEGMLTAERVIITEEGEERVLGSETSASPQEGRESRVFQDVSLDGQIQAEAGDNGCQKSASACKATTKPKTCLCCSVM